VGGDVSVDSETLLMTDFVNLRMKSVQSFRRTYRGRLCVCVYKTEYSYVYEYLYLYCVFKKIFLLEKCLRYLPVHPIR
jgi:hypothetical protein